MCRYSLPTACLTLFCLMLCALAHRKKKPLKSQPRDLEMCKTETKDGGLASVLTKNVSTTAAVATAEAVATTDSSCGNGCCCGGGDGSDGGGGCGVCEGCG